ncbi:TonB-dependent receptor domain-containing protein [Phenylobacterium deserti]|uniref:TonB-dependent receptor domain-containing protein n=1 Tax=Phenylobacterium deserti TaxID=1914756 RepID=UPI00140425BB|nr:TonB-dependent receptor [Phenylobacterium deserti]
MRKRILFAAVAAVPSLALAQQAPSPAPTETPAQKSGETAVGEVVVTAETPQVQTSIDRRSYSLGADLQAQTGSIGDALRNVPSVEVDVQGNVSLRGDSNVTILVDGKPSTMFEGESRASSLQSMPANQIERVEVMTNPSAEFRNDGSGVINLITKKSRGAGRTGSARVTVANEGRVNASLNGGYNSPRLSVTADLNIRQDSQKQLTTDERQRLHLTSGEASSVAQVQDLNSNLDFDTARVAVDYDLDRKTRLSAELRAMYVDLTVGGPSQVTQTNAAGGLTSAFQRDLDLHQIRANGSGTFTFKRTFDQAGEELTLSAAYEATNDDRVRAGRTLSFIPIGPDAYDRQELTFDYRRTQLKGDYVRPIGAATLKTGFDLQFDDNSYRNLGLRGGSRAALAEDASLSNLFLFEQSMAQAYVTYEQRFGDLSVLAGVRGEDVQIDLDQATQSQQFENDYRRLYPSLHLGWKLDDDRKLTASYSERVQRPNPLQFNSFPVLLDPLNLRAGNPDLKPQQTRAFEFGYERRGPATFLATLYYRRTENGFADVVRDIGGGRFLTTSANITESRAAGLELVLNGKLNPKLSYNVSTNFGWTEIEPQPLGSPETRSAFTPSGRASLSWQITPDDLLQVNAFVNAKQLTPQGYLEPSAAIDLGYRRKLNDRVSLIFQVQDLAHSFRLKQVIDTPTLKARTENKFDTRQVRAGVIWTFGGGKVRDPGFDFGGGPAPSQ